MSSRIVYTPDRWVVVGLVGPRGDKILKVFAGYYGGFSYGDSWNLSSGITNTARTEGRYKFVNKSGSVYVCDEASYGMSAYMQQVYASFCEELLDLGLPALRILSIDEVNKL